MALIDKKTALLAAQFLIILFSLGAQNTNAPVILAIEIERLERAAQNTAERYEALKNKALLYELSGDREGALATWQMAAFTGSHREYYHSILESSRLMIAMGEYERADVELRKIPPDSSEITLKAALLWAQLMAFGLGDTRYLVQLAADPNQLSSLSKIYFILWKTSGDESWKNKLLQEFPQSPEAHIVRDGSANVNIALSPQWLLGAIPQTQSRAAEVPHRVIQSGQEANRIYFQTGLFRQEANAKNEAARLERAGFSAVLMQRRVNGVDLFAVAAEGKEGDNTLSRLRSAGWTDAFILRQE